MIELLCKRTGASIRTVCQTMELPRSSYYHATTETPSQKADRNIGLAIQRIFKLHRSRYGHRRIWRELRDKGIVVEVTRTYPLEKLVWTNKKDPDNERNKILNRTKDPHPA